MRVTIQTNVADIAKRITELGRQGPFVAAVSLTRSVKAAQAAIRTEEQQVFDRPTPYALNGTYLKAATKTNLVAEVGVKDKSASKGAPLERVLGPEIYGGGRAQKGFERLLQQSGVLPAGWLAVPAAGAKLDGNGNVTRGQLEQILAALEVQRSAGQGRRATRARSTSSRKVTDYFALPATRRGLQPGIYLKRQFAHGTSIKPVFIFVRAATYRTRLKFDDVAKRAVANTFLPVFNAEAAKAIASVRLR
jgi:hypothetical protein